MKQLLITLIALSFALNAGATDSLKYKVQRKNVINFNPTPMLAWNTRNATFNYERMLFPKQSACVSLGYFVLPQVLDDNIANVMSLTNRKKNGYSVGFEYRFYLGKRNKFMAPDGLYVGPYYSLMHNKFTNDVQTYDNNVANFSGKLEGTINIHNIGAELGYQFIFAKRFSLDLILVGPSISLYKADLELTGTSSLEQQNEFFQDLRERLENRFPAVGELLQDGDLQQSGKLDRTWIGWRYCLRFGIAF